MIADIHLISCWEKIKTTLNRYKTKTSQLKSGWDDFMRVLKVEGVVDAGVESRVSSLLRQLQFDAHAMKWSGIQAYC